LDAIFFINRCRESKKKQGHFKTCILTPFFSLTDAGKVKRKKGIFPDITKISFDGMPLPNLHLCRLCQALNIRVTLGKTVQATALYNKHALHVLANAMDVATMHGHMVSKPTAI
jgi:hypothetical protein